MFINQTPNNLENNLAANLHVGKKVKLMTLCVFCPLFILLGVAFLWIDPSDLIGPIFLFSLAVLFAAFYLLFFKRILKRSIKKLMEGKEGVNTFTFDEDSFTIQTETNAGLSSQATGVYSALTKVEEYDDMWLLYYNKANMFIVMKECMTQGTAEDFSVFLNVKLAERMKVKTKKKA